MKMTEIKQLPPQVDKSLNKGMVGSDVYLCFKRSLNMAEKISYQVSLHLKPGKDRSQCLIVNFFLSRRSSTISRAPTLTTASHSTQKRFSSNILMQIPINFDDGQVPPFCLPLGASIEVWPSSAAAATTIQSTFVLTQQSDGLVSRLYGSALSFYEVKF